MSILTNRELEFLASLRTDWNRLYWNEFARLQQEDADRRDASHQRQCIIVQFGRPKDRAPNLRVIN
jgi:hypothetical protein